MDAHDAYKQLKAALEDLFRLNPDLPVSRIAALYDLASAAGPAHFDAVASVAERLIDSYLVSPPKRVEGMLFDEYFDYINRSARLLSAAGEVGQGESGSPRTPESVALVHAEKFAPLDWCKILNRAGIPKKLSRAIDACRSRNELLTSVVEYILIILQRMDMDRAVHWQLTFLEARRGNLDPDVVRDFLNAWLTFEPAPREVLSWAEQWSGDSDLLNQWPYVVRLSDRLLCRHALERWQAATKPGNALLAHLHLLVRARKRDEDRLLSWLQGALLQIGESVARFLALNVTTDAEVEAWRSAAMVREIRRIESLFTPALLLADLILGAPSGPHSFAVSVFGLAGEGRSQWEEKLLAMAREAVRRAFMRDLRNGRKPVDTIRRLTFGDETAFLRMYGALNWETENFESLAQRDAVASFLAHFYASYREPQLMAAEVSRRYRNLMRLLHEDHLRRVLKPDHFREIGRSSLIPELSSLAADCRRYLTKRRSLESELEELVAAEMDFVASIRLRRLRVIHRLLG